METTMTRTERRRKIREFIKVNYWRRLARSMRWPVRKTSFVQKAKLREHATVAPLDAKAASDG